MHSFPVDDTADHAETPFDAYRDIEPFLFQLGLRRKRPKAKVRIYDPYYCEGRAAMHMRQLGFAAVYNRNEDFYEASTKNLCLIFIIRVFLRELRAS